MSDKFEVLEYSLGDCSKITPRGFYNTGENFVLKTDTMYKSGQALMWTIKLNGEIVAVLGLTLIYSGVAEAWSLTSELVNKCPKSYFKAVKHLLEATQKELNIHRFQMHIRSELFYLHRWAKKIGFKPEGELKKFGPDKSDHHIYARVI